VLSPGSSTSCRRAGPSRHPGSMIRKTKLKLRREAPSWVGPELPPELRLDGSRRKHMEVGR